jgi:hypothetical protein
MNTLPDGTPQVLTDEHCNCIDRCLQSIPGTTKLIDALKKCGMDCSAAEEANNLHRQQAETIKSIMFPNRS